MPKYRVPLEGWASASITVETDATDPEEIYEEAMQQGVSGICAQCSGWGRDFSLEVGDEWEPITDEKTGTAIVYDENGDQVRAPGGED